jgi:hypothetical protein
MRFGRSELIIATSFLAFSASAVIAQDQPVDPLKILVSLNDQRLDVYRGTERVATSRVSTGRDGYRTPTGVFSILEKRRWHRSNIYSNAPMPFMQRLTWSGIALHAGHVPNHPASHGCIRLPANFAKSLFGQTDVGAHVIITRGTAQPQPISHDALPQPRPMTLVSVPLEIRSAEAGTGTMSDGPRVENSLRAAALAIADLDHDQAEMQFYSARSDKPVRILITRRTGRERIKDVQNLLRQLGYDPGPVDGYMGALTGSAIRAFQRGIGWRETGAFSNKLVDALHRAAGAGPVLEGHIYVRQGFKSVFDMPMQIIRPDEPLGTHFFSVLDFEEDQSEAGWLVVSEDDTASAKAALERVSMPEEARQWLSRALMPGSSLIVSDNGLGRETGRGTDFVVLTH